MNKQIIQLASKREEDAKQAYLTAKRAYEKVMSDLTEIRQSIIDRKTFRREETKRLYAELENREIHKADLDKVEQKISEFRQMELTLKNKELRLEMECKVKEKKMNEANQEYKKLGVRKEKLGKVAEDFEIVRKNSVSKAEEEENEESFLNSLFM